MAINKYPSSIAGLPKSSIALVFSTSTPGGAVGASANRLDFTYNFNWPAGVVTIQGTDTNINIFPNTVASGGSFSSSSNNSTLIDESTTSSSVITVAIPSRWKTGGTLATSSTAMASAAFANGLIFATVNGVVSRVSQFFVSTNATTWTAGTIGTATGDRAWASSAYDGTFYWMGNSGDQVIYVSTNGTSWTSRFGAHGTGILYSATAPMKYVVYNRLGTSGIQVSTNGTTWTSRAEPSSGQITSMIYANGWYVGSCNSGMMITSTDGLTWTTRNANNGGNNMTNVVYKSPFYYGFMSNGIRTSTDAINWVSRATTFGGSSLGGMTDGTWLVAFGSGGSDYLVSSTDGTAWLSRNDSETSSNEVGTYTNSTIGFIVFRPPSSGTATTRFAQTPGGTPKSQESVILNCYGASNI
jgi:hypothetical protein